MHFNSVKLAVLSSVNHIPDLDHMEIVDDIRVLCLCLQLPLVLTMCLVISDVQLMHLSVRYILPLGTHFLPKEIAIST